MRRQTVNRLEAQAPRSAFHWQMVQAAVLVALSNLPFWLLSLHYALARPVINDDSALALALVSLAPIAGMSAMVGAWGLDLLHSLSLNYHFGSAAEFLQSARFASHINWLDFFSLKLLMAVVLFTGTFALLWLVARRWRPGAASILAVLAIAAAADAFNGSGLTRWIGGDSLRIAANISGSPGYNLVNAALQAQQAASRPISRWPQGTSFDIASWAHQNQGNVLLIVVESFGEYQDTALKSWLMKKLVDSHIQNRWVLEAGTVPFSGSTTFGELRTLCGLSSHYSRLKPELMNDCVPNRLQKLGYSVFGIHGFTGRMFDRLSWWPKIGLTRSQFSEDLTADTPQCGGAFRGACDSAVLDIGFQKLKIPKQFVYVLTLNSHLPLAPTPVPHDLRIMCRAAAVSDTVCQLTAQHGALLSQLHQLLRVSDGPPLLVLVVGDHAPPFIAEAELKQFSADRVPQWVLIPK